MSTRDRVAALLVIAFALLVYFFLPESCPEPARRAAFILGIAAGFWAFEVVPIFVTSLITVLLLSFLLAEPGDGYTVYLIPFASPVIMLFFGGFVLAKGLGKYEADRAIASRLIGRFRGGPHSFLFGVMLTTAILSMWISNTAATLIMMGIAHPLFLNNRLGKGLLLAIPFSANIGGLGTPIGTPPNALAVGFLSDYGISVSFIDWMLLCVPLAALCLVATWMILSFLYLRGEEGSELPKLALHPLSENGKRVLFIALGTIILWLTAPLHGIPEPLVSLLSVATLTAVGLISMSDIRQLNWEILILMWGGLALGLGIENSGLGSWIVQSLFPVWSEIYLVALFALVAMLFSLFISNTAAAALILPIALEATRESRSLVAITIALMCGIAMIFPVSTPPNAIAYGSGLIKNREMIQAGAACTLACALIILLGFWWVIPFVLS